MKVVHVTSVHPWYDTRIFWRECRSLARAGHVVELVVPSDDPQSEEIVEGVRLVRVPAARSRLHRVFITSWRVVLAALRRRADIYHIHDPELLPFGVLMQVRGRTVVYDAHEDVGAQIRTKYWIPGPLRRPLARLMAVVVKRTTRLLAGVVAATPHIRDQFQPNERCVSVMNFPLIENGRGTSGYSARDNRIAYVGAVTVRRGVVELVQALERVPEHLEARLDLVGDFRPADLEPRVAALPAWKRVRAHGWLSRDGVHEVLNAARIGVVALHPTPNHLESYPTKLFEYMAAGVPVVASNFPLWCRIIDDCGCGLTVDPLDPAALGAALTWLLSNPEAAEAMGRRGRAAVEAEYNWERQGDALARLYRDLSKRSAGRESTSSDS